MPVPTAWQKIGRVSGIIQLSLFDWVRKLMPNGGRIATLDFMTTFGYLDAGTGSIIIQSIVGVAAGVAVFGRRALYSAGHRLKSIFSRSESEAGNDKP